MSSRRIVFLRGALWPVLFALAVIAASHRPQLASPDINNIDKIAHFAVYGLLATLVCRIGRGWRAAFCGLLVASAFGATDEWHQSLVPGRSPQFGDWLADTFGAALAVALYWGAAPYRRLLEWPVLGRRSPNSNPAAGPPHVKHAAEDSVH